MKSLKTLLLIIFACLAIAAPALAEVNIESVKITPDEPKTTDDLNCTFVATTNTSFDVVNLTWYNNTKVHDSYSIEYENNTEHSEVLDSAHTREGETWKCEVYAQDNETNQTRSDEVEIEETEENTAEVTIEYLEIITDEPRTTDNLECSFNATTNISFDTVEIRWYNNTELFLSNDITNIYINGTEHTDILYSMDTKKADIWKCEVYVRDKDASDTREDSVLIRNTEPVISSISDKKANVESSFSYTVEVDDPDVDDNADSLTYELLKKPDDMEIDEDGRISWTPTIEQEGEHEVEVRVRDESNAHDTETFKIDVDRQMLSLDRLRASCSPRRCYDDLDEDGGIIEEVRPGSTLELDVRLRNLWDSDNDIRDIEIEGFLERMGGEGNQEIDKSIRRLRAGRTEEVTLSFDIPLSTDEDTYLLELYIEGEDDDGTFYDIGPIDIDVEVEKEDEKLYFRTASVFPSSVRCERDITIRTRIQNIGDRDQDNAQLAIMSQELNIEEFEFFDVESGDYSDRHTQFENDYRFTISDTVSPGNYEIELRAYYEDGNIYEREILDVRVNECEVPEEEEEEEKEEEEEVEVIDDPGLPPTQVPAPVPAEPIEEEKAFTDTTAFLFILGGAFVVLLAMVILLAIIAFRR